MFKQLNNLGGNEFFMLLSLFIFFTFFIGATIFLLRMKKTHISYMSNIPLDHSSADQENPQDEK